MKNKETWRISSQVITLYVFILLCIYPFYYENGYYNMGTAKCRFFLSISVMVFFAMVITSIVDMIMQKKGINLGFIWKKSSATEKFLFAYIIMVLLSFAFSPFKQSVLWGSTDWYIGTIPLLLVSFFAYFIIYKWEEQEWMISGCIIVSGILFLLGICNRFSFYPIPIEPQNSSFISTLGNINWFCGYMSVISPVGIGVFVFTKDEEYRYKWQKWLLAFYVLIVFVTGFCQGSESVFIWNAALFLVLFGILLKNTSGIKKWLFLVGMWGMSGQFIRLLKILFPEKYNYESTVFINTGLTLIIASLAIFLYIVMCLCLKEEKELPKILRSTICRIISGAVVIGGLIWLILAVYNTNVGISFLAENPLFLLNEKWGNGRGIIFKVSFDLFERMSPLQKLFGVGADGYSAFAYSIPEIQVYLQSYFGENILTNAHCEILTNLINLGILGTTAFVGIFTTFVVRCIKKGEETPILYIPAICVICYFANNLISFAQVLNIPFLFLILGIGEYYLRKNESEYI